MIDFEEKFLETGEAYYWEGDARIVITTEIESLLGELTLRRKQVDVATDSLKKESSVERGRALIAIAVFEQRIEGATHA